MLLKVKTYHTQLVLLKSHKKAQLKSQIRFYGANTSTAGILEFVGSTSNGSASGARLTINADGSSTFAGLVSGITPVNAANFVTKAYVDGSGGGTGPFLPLAGGTLTGALIGTTATFNPMATIEYSDISTGENRGLRIINTSGTDQQWNITAGITGVENESFCIRDATANVNALTIAISSGNATFAGNVGIGATATDGNLQVKKTGISTGITNVLMNASFSEGSGSLKGLQIGL